MVIPGGDVVEIGEDDPQRLHAAQAAVGMLGVITEVELEVATAYRLRERIEHWSWDEAWGRFVFFADPDGNRWAVQQVPKRN